MEQMHITVISIVEHGGRYSARARAEAQDAEIMVEVCFKTDERVSDAKLWLKARDQCLRYLDIA